jgi:hypothetical protein
MPEGLHEKRGKESEQSFAENNDDQEQRNKPDKLFLGGMDMFEDKTYEIRFLRSTMGDIQEHLIDDGLNKIDETIGEKSDEESRGECQEKPFFLSKSELEKLEYVLHSKT